MLVRDAVAAFLADVVAQGNELSTMRCYRSRLNGLAIRSGELEMSGLSAELVNAWLSSATDGRAPDTVRLTVIAWERLQTWAIEARLLPAELVAKQRKPGGRKREALPTREQTQALLEHLAPEFRPLFRALRLTGARPGELCAAEIADWDQAAGMIVRQRHKTARKTGRPRIIPVGHPSLVEILRAAIGERTSGPIFLRPSGKAWTVTAASRMYRLARRAAGLPESLVLYLTRHEHATAIYRQTGDLKSVSDALGHANLQTTMRYARPQLDMMQQNQRALDLE